MRVRPLADQMLRRRFAKVLKGLAVRNYRSAARRGVFPVIEHEATLRRLKPATVIDVGANRGQFCLLAAQELPEATIYAFEPLQEAADLLARLMDSHPAFCLTKTAVGAASGTREIHIAQAEDSSSLLRSRAAQAFDGARTVERRMVPVVTLDEELSSVGMVSPVLVKVDVQGLELEVLKGAEQVLQHCSYLLVELSFVEIYSGQALAHEVIEFLSKAGWRLQSCYDVRLGRLDLPVQADFVFEREVLGE